MPARRSWSATRVGCWGSDLRKPHHLVHWARGGGTDLDNLVLLCHGHHRLVHEGGWTTSGHSTHDLRFHDPTGRLLRAFTIREDSWHRPAMAGSGSSPARLPPARL